jgi:hypothetical protein
VLPHTRTIVIVLSACFVWSNITTRNHRAWVQLTSKTLRISNTAPDNGRAIVSGGQFFSLYLYIWAPYTTGILPSVVQVTFVVDKVAMGQFLCDGFGCPLPLHILIYHLGVVQRGPFGAAVPRNSLNSHHLQLKKSPQGIQNVKYNIRNLNQPLSQTFIAGILNLWVDMPVGCVTMILVNQMKYPVT